VNPVNQAKPDRIAEGEGPDDGVRQVVDAVMRARTAVRRFLDRPVDKNLVVDVLDVARSAPSNSNTQPWRVYAIAGEVKRALSEALGDAHANRQEEYTPCYKHFPDVLSEQYRSRQNSFAAEYYSCLGILRSDSAARAHQTGRNFQFFGAPIGFIFTIDRTLERGSWLDYGMFLQNIMIAATARGLDTCPQISFVKYHEIIRAHLSIPANETVVCGMSMGYADRSEQINSLRLPREPVDVFCSFSGFDT
jgi:nitroreductase